MIEDRFLGEPLTVDGPVSALRAVSHDPTLKQTLTLADGRTLTAVQLQLEYLDLAKKYVEDRYGADADAQTVDVLARWESVLDRLERDPMLCATELDWVAKLKLLEQYRQRDGLEWGDAKLELIDYQYSDIRPEKGLYNKLAAAGRIERLLADAEVDDAMHEPPEDTRAYFRGRCLSKFARRRGRRVLGLGDLRPARPGVAPAGADASTRCAAARRTWGSSWTARETAEALVAELHSLTRTAGNPSSPLTSV